MNKKAPILKTELNNAFKSTADVASNEIVNSVVAQLTPLERTNVSTAQRVKFTTALRPNVSTWIKVYAIQHNTTAADIIERLILEFKEKGNG